MSFLSVSAIVLGAVALGLFLWLQFTKKEK